MAGFSSEVLNDGRIRGVAGESISAFDVCYKKSDGKYWKAKADSATTMPGIVIALEAISGEAVGLFAETGSLITNAGWNFVTVGALVYVSEATAGLVTLTAPTGSGEQVQILGYAETATTIRFVPSLTLIELT